MASSPDCGFSNVRAVTRLYSCPLSAVRCPLSHVSALRILLGMVEGLARVSATFDTFAR